MSKFTRILTRRAFLGKAGASTAAAATVGGMAAAKALESDLLAAARAFLVEWREASARVDLLERGLDPDLTDAHLDAVVFARNDVENRMAAWLASVLRKPVPMNDRDGAPDDALVVIIDGWSFLFQAMARAYVMPPGHALVLGDRA